MIKSPSLIVPYACPHSFTREGVQVPAARDAVVAVRHEESRRRTVLWRDTLGLGGTSLRVIETFPLSFVVAYPDGPDEPPTTLVVLQGEGRFTDGTKITYQYASKACLGRVAAKAVRERELDVIDAYWMTAGTFDTRDSATMLSLSKKIGDVSDASWQIRRLQRRFLSTGFTF